MTNGYALNVLSADRPGIVAGVSKTIARLNGNIESCSQTVVSGFFTLIMIVTFPESMEESELKQHLTDISSRQNARWWPDYLYLCKPQNGKESTWYQSRIS